MYPHLSFPQRILAKPWHATHRKRGVGVVKWEEAAALTVCSYGDVLGEVKHTDFLSFLFYISFFY